MSITWTWLRANCVLRGFSHASLQILIKCDLGLLGLKEVRHLRSLHFHVLLVGCLIHHSLRGTRGSRVLRTDSRKSLYRIGDRRDVSISHSPFEWIFAKGIPCIPDVTMRRWGCTSAHLIPTQGLHQVFGVLILLSLRDLCRQLYKPIESLSHRVVLIVIKPLFSWAERYLSKVKWLCSLKYRSLRVNLVEAGAEVAGDRTWQGFFWGVREPQICIAFLPIHFN